MLGKQTLRYAIDWNNVKNSHEILWLIQNKKKTLKNIQKSFGKLKNK